ncbi:hypothetical protein Bhyg_14444 [Pseudolycoriella hygida]|uniref:Uncharacterized protein n=1 Tax=Pseudolycoriella hygida TaxID=35572 RepID=A0A9Q0RXF7_9DIPT|nr:hypothetical protein Bhyg_14444 [Pseudolycoriella hygida]
MLKDGMAFRRWLEDGLKDFLEFVVSTYIGIEIKLRIQFSNSSTILERQNIGETLQHVTQHFPYNLKYATVPWYIIINILKSFQSNEECNLYAREDFRVFRKERLKQIVFRVGLYGCVLCLEHVPSSSSSIKISLLL